MVVLKCRAASSKHPETHVCESKQHNMSRNIQTIKAFQIKIL